MNIYKIGETIDQKKIVKTGSLYRVRGLVDSETEFEGFETPSHSSATCNSPSQSKQHSYR